MSVIQDTTALKQFMVDSLGKFAGILGYTVADFSNESDSTLLFFGVESPDLVENQLQLRAVAKYNAFYKAFVDVNTFYDFEADAASYNRSQVARQLKNLVDDAYSGIVTSGAIPQEIFITTLEYMD